MVPKAIDALSQGCHQACGAKVTAWVEMLNNGAPYGPKEMIKDAKTDEDMVRVSNGARCTVMSTYAGRDDSLKAQEDEIKEKCGVSSIYELDQLTSDGGTTKFGSGSNVYESIKNTK
ncbi:hypothetical protein H4R34_001789 [Dimargaris verticillata]|uniref:Uncharacterized protein n=1 Tax=Dimargaris verticillata TaxID=2761393 RepID=A0A9W8B999_9FUNG|nr:hypothetical protein H4R34_001789 [Dimargaris verticillata]